jgi:hypothetical protein
MKQIVTIIIIIAASGCVSAQSVIIPQFEWVTVMNPDGIAQEYSNFGRLYIEFGDTCSIKRGGEIFVMAEKNGAYLVEYQSPNKATGTSCPTETLFFIPKTEFEKLEGIYEQSESEQNELKQWIIENTSQ